MNISIAVEGRRSSAHFESQQGVEGSSKATATVLPAIHPNLCNYQFMTDSPIESPSTHNTQRKRKASDSGYECAQKKRKGSFIGFDRITNACRWEPIPSYRVKKSRQKLDQERGIDWLTSVGKDRFEERVTGLLGQWGVKKAHKGTCILCPEDWSSLDPMALMDIFNNDTCPTQGSGRLSYQYSDHATSLIRAAAWFSEDTWPRIGIELDNFIGGGPFKPMDASHLCHHDHCIVHVTWEPANVNHDRKECHALARYLRQHNLPVPESCAKHKPSCLMQVS